MTRINRKVVRLTAARFRGEEIVVELHPMAVFVRTKRSPESFPIPRSCTRTSTKLLPCGTPNV